VVAIATTDNIGSEKWMPLVAQKMNLLDGFAA